MKTSYKGFAVLLLAGPTIVLVASAEKQDTMDVVKDVKTFNDIRPGTTTFQPSTSFLGGSYPVCPTEGSRNYAGPGTYCLYQSNGLAALYQCNRGKTPVRRVATCRLNCIQNPPGVEDTCVDGSPPPGSGFSWSSLSSFNYPSYYSPQNYYPSYYPDYSTKWYFPSHLAFFVDPSYPSSGGDSFGWAPATVLDGRGCSSTYRSFGNTISCSDGTTWTDDESGRVRQTGTSYPNSNYYPSSNPSYPSSGGGDSFGWVPATVLDGRGCSSTYRSFGNTISCSDGTTWTDDESGRVRQTGTSYERA